MPISNALPKQPIPLCPYDVPTYRTVADAIAGYTGDDHIYALYPRRIERAARTFMAGFPGEVLYAVKANPHPSVLNILWAEGVRHFDVASLREIDLVQALFPDASLYLMHPVKSRRTIREAYAKGIRDFAFDHGDELAKILDCTEHAADLNLHLRLALAPGHAAMPLCGKYGADYAEAADLLRAARAVSARLGLCFHVGSQCLDTASYDGAIAYAREVIDAANVEIDCLDVGGGFPVAYPDMSIVPMTDYFSAIRASLEARGFGHVEILGEPGRALCAEGGSTLTRVELRKGGDLYLNDGTYGSLFDAGQFGWKFPVRLHKQGGGFGTADMAPFRFFGPTCDSTDIMAGPFHLPADIGEGDWIEVEHIGAYGQALATQFNGFYSTHTVAILEDQIGGQHG